MSVETLAAAGIVGGAMTVLAVFGIVRWRRARRLVRLLDDPRYSHAIDLFSHHWNADSCFQDAVDYLVGQGVRLRTARTDLMRLLGSVAMMEWTSWGVQDGRSRRAGRRRAPRRVSHG